MLAIGLMSGTSLDGVDAALVSITGSKEYPKFDLVKYVLLPYSEDFKKKITGRKDSPIVEIDTDVKRKDGSIYSDKYKS